MSHYLDPSDKNYTRVYKAQTPAMLKAFNDFDAAVFAPEGPELDLKVRELIAVAVGITTQCVYCIEFHSQAAAAAGATEAELAEAAWVSAAVRAGGSYTHGRLAFKFTEGQPAHNH